MSLPRLLSALAVVAAPAFAQITEAEQRWLRAGLPVLQYAKTQQLPIDVVVQPQDAPGHAPLAMDFVDGRCKLVLSMRGNPAADATLAEVAPALAGAVIEAIVAHEVGHCWRHASGSWNRLPAGFIEAEPSLDDQERLAGWREMRARRREEGFADLVGLAWTLEHHPTQYEAVHAWFERVRAYQPVPGSHHDTRAWIRLAKDGAAFPPGPTPFERARALWSKGALNGD